MLQNCRKTKRKPVRKGNKTKNCSGESEIFGHHCLQTRTLDNQSAAEKFSVHNGEIYNFPSQLPHFDSFLGTCWHLLRLLCHCPHSLLSSPFLILTTLQRDLHKMTERHLLHSFSSVQAARCSALVHTGTLEGLNDARANTIRQEVSNAFIVHRSVSGWSGDGWWQTR